MVLAVVENKPVSLKLCLYGGKEATVERSFSRDITLDDLQQEMRNQFNIGCDREAKLWVNSEVFTFRPSTSSSPSDAAKPLSPSKSENNIQQSATTLKPPPSPPPLPNFYHNNSTYSSSSASPTSSARTPTVVTRSAAESMQKPIPLPDSSTSPNVSRASLLSTSVSDSPISSSTSLRQDDTSNTGNDQEQNAAQKTLSEIGISDSAVVTLEVINADGTWPSSRPRYGTVSTRSSKAQPGLCGLSNMGNTCFMNAALQCLSNTQPLTQFILTDEFIKDINTDNPLGMHGEIARTYAELIKVMWSGNNTSFLPREFKCAVSRFAPQFNGFAQQDCQELMAFLLDGLHEDLNRIHNKPYIEIKNDVESRPDEVVADESWANYKKRNDSIVVDTFHAMMKSTLVCPGCKLVSVTFDPFCYLSLPLPVKREKQVNLTFLPAPGKVDLSKLKAVERLSPEELKILKQYGGSISSFNGVVEEHAGYVQSENRPKCCKIQVPRTGPASEICDIVARTMNEERSSQFDKITPSNLVVAELSSDGRISKVYEPNEHYSTLSDDLVVVEKLSNYVLPLYMRMRKNKTSNAGNLLTKAMFLHVPDMKYDTLYLSIIASLSNLTEEASDDEDSPPLNSESFDDVWFRLLPPALDSSGDSESETMNCDDENDRITKETSMEADIEDRMQVVGSELKTNGNSSTPAEKKKLTKISPNARAFDICIVNSFGNHSIETLGHDKKECDYNSKLYLGATFSPDAAWTNQFKHLINSSYSDSIESFTPKVSPKPTLQLKDCITQFLNVERLGADDPWYCPKCKKHEQATKKFDIWSLPKVLIIHLKRFSFSRSWRDKIDTLVEFPVDGLDMSDYVLNPKQKAKQKLIYNLIGVANHFGGLGGGHYTAYAKNAVQNAWYSFDDALVTQTSSTNIVTRSAYVLFYQLQDS